VTETVRLEDATPYQLEIAKNVRAQYRPAIVVMSGQRMGDKIVVSDTNAVVGRAPDAEICLQDVGVSWEHARLEDQGGSWAVIDMGSTNGTVVNGERIDEKPIQHGDKIVFGKTMVRFEVQDAADQAFDEFVTRLINVDDLTGLYLRRRFDSELDQLLARARRENRSIGMLVMDLDGIKGINDHHGHRFGAYTISESGKVIGRVVGDRGIACRWGGDEFLAALFGHDLEGALAVGEEIRQAISDHHFEHEEVVLAPGISVGASSFPEHAQNADALFHAADEAMYRAKRAGKNRVSR
jgi:diguanylate cyclase (GGDEF)-like protein